MYKLEYLPLARQDLIDIVSYISQELHNPYAAEQLAVKLTDAAEGILSFPYACPAYIPIRQLKHEYRKLLVQNYIMLYWVDDAAQTVTIARVVYARRDYENMLEDSDSRADNA